MIAYYGHKQLHIKDFVHRIRHLRLPNKLLNVVNVQPFQSLESNNFHRSIDFFFFWIFIFRSLGKIDNLWICLIFLFLVLDLRKNNLYTVDGLETLTRLKMLFLAENPRLTIKTTLSKLAKVNSLEQGDIFDKPNFIHFQISPFNFQFFILKSFIWSCR